MPGKEQWLYLANIFVSRWVNSGKNIQAYHPKNILCIKWDEIGDMATCTHVFSLLKKRFPNAEIDVITKPYSAPIIHGNPNINRVYLKIEDWKKKYDFVIELRGTWKTLFKSLRYYPKVRLDRGTVRARHRGNQLHEYLTNYEIIEPVLGNLANQNPEIFISNFENQKVQDFLSHHGIVNYAVLHTGARRELRRWPAAHFARLAKWLFEEKGLQIILAGTEDELPQLNEISELSGVHTTLFTKNFSLTELAALIEKSSLFVGNESGPLQIACLLPVPVVSIFGPGVPNVFYPRGKGRRVLHKVLECNPCDQIHCVHPDNTCMMRVSVEDVKKAVNEAISEL